MPTRKGNSKKSRGGTLSRVAPSENTSPKRPAFFSLKGLKWQEGKGALKGLKVAVVHEDRASGTKAMFVKISNKKPDESLHYHTIASQTVLLEGTVGTVVNGKRITMSPGDYFRSPANWIHADSHGDATMFMMVSNPDPTIGGAADFRVVTVEK